MWDQQQQPATPLRVKHTFHVLPLPSRAPSKMLRPCNKEYQQKLKGVVYRCISEAFFTLEDSPTASDCELRAHHMSRRHETTAPELDHCFMTLMLQRLEDRPHIRKFQFCHGMPPSFRKGGTQGSYTGEAASSSLHIYHL